MQDFFWSFYNQRNQTRYDGFSTTQAKSFVSSIIPSTATDWIVWKEGTPEWLPLSSYPELFAELSDFTYAAAESEFNLAGTQTENTGIRNAGLESENTFTNHDPLDKETALKRGLEEEMPETRTDLLDGIVPDDDYIDISGIEIVDLKFEKGNAPKPELRKAARYRHRVACEVDYGGPGILKAETLDISMGGLLLNQILPTGAKTQIKVRLVKSNQVINTLCQSIPDRSGRQSRRFRFIDIDKIELLRTWLINRS